MGIGGEYVCDKCGYKSKQILMGPGFLSAPCHPMIGTRIMNGEYGEKAKKILEENPDSEFSFYMGIYQCRCGNITSEDVVRIWSRGKKIDEGVPWTFGGPKTDVYERGKILYRPVVKCKECGKRMCEVMDPPMEMPCPKCGGTMGFNHDLFWD